MSADEAVLVLALYRFARHRAQHGELLTALAADKLAAMARAIGIDAARTPSEFGVRAGDVWWTTDVLRSAVSIVERTGRHRSLARLNTLLEDLRVADVEGYCESGESETTVPEDTGVYTVRRQPRGVEPSGS